MADAIENLESDVEVVDKRREEWNIAWILEDIMRGFVEGKAMNQIASGLRHLHDVLGLIHRDIKPQNILISSSSSSSGPPYRGLISDFGLCKKLDIPSNQSRFVSTTYGSIAQGTAGWMAPEMLKCMDDELDLLATSGDTSVFASYQQQRFLLRVWHINNDLPVRVPNKKRRHLRLRLSLLLHFDQMGAPLWPSL